MKNILILVDFDNYAALNDVPKQKPKQHHVSSCLYELVSYITKWCHENSISSADLKIRLYGGWHNCNSVDDTRTDLKKMIDSFIFQDGVKRAGAYRIRMTAAEAPIFSPDSIFKRTLQEDSIKIKIPNRLFEECELKEKCGTKAVAQWLQNGCSGCKINHKDILKKKCQKNVDTTIVADLMYAVFEKAYDVIIIVSADYDMLPGILFATINRQQIVMFRRFETVWYDCMIPDCDIVSDIYPHYR